MKSDTNKDIWVEDVMDSLSGLQRIPAVPDMYGRVLSRINGTTNNKSYSLFPRIAAAAVLLLAINIASVIHATHYNKSDKGSGKDAAYQVVSESISNLSEDSF